MVLPGVVLPKLQQKYLAVRTEAVVNRYTDEGLKIAYLKINLLSETILIANHRERKVLSFTDVNQLDFSQLAVELGYEKSHKLKEDAKVVVDYAHDIRTLWVEGLQRLYTQIITNISTIGEINNCLKKIDRLK